MNRLINDKSRQRIKLKKNLVQNSHGTVDLKSNYFNHLLRSKWQTTIPVINQSFSNHLRQLLKRKIRRIH